MMALPTPVQWAGSRPPIREPAVTRRCPKILGHASCQLAVLAGRKRSALALAGMTVGYAAVSVISLLFVAGLVGFATGQGG